MLLGLKKDLTELGSGSVVTSDGVFGGCEENEKRELGLLATGVAVAGVWAVALAGAVGVDSNQDLRGVDAVAGVGAGAGALANQDLLGAVSAIGVGSGAVTGTGIGTGTGRGLGAGAAVAVA